MKRHNFEFEKLIISKTIGLAFHRFDFMAPRCFVWAG
jgi:hypothetical protein